MDRRVLYPGPGRIPWAAAPDLRGRPYRISAELRVQPGQGGVLLAQGDRLAGFALGVTGGRLWHRYVHGGLRSEVTASLPLPEAVWTTAGVEVRVRGGGGLVTLWADDRRVGQGRIPQLCRDRLSVAPMDVGRDLGVTVGDYPPPARFTGQLRRIVIAAGEQDIDERAALRVDAALG